MPTGPASGVEVVSDDGTVVQNRAESDRWCEEGQALLRLAASAADGAVQDEVFMAVAATAMALTDAAAATVIRLDNEDEYTIVGSCAGTAPVGTRVVLDVQDGGLIAEILRNERSARVPRQPDPGVTDRLPDAYLGPRGAGIPLTLDDRLWGVLEVSIGSPEQARIAARRLRDCSWLVTGAIATALARAESKSLVDERAALRRIHAVAGRGGTGSEVLAAIAAEVSAWMDGLSVVLVRHAYDGASVVIASADPDPPDIESEPPDDRDLIAQVVRSAAPTRMDKTTERPRNDRPVDSAVGVPISVAGHLWGVLVARSPARSIPPRAAYRLARFAEAITPTILSAQARTQLADEQAALRRVAELAARDAPVGEVLGAVALEASSVAGVEFTTLLRCNSDSSTEIVALHDAPEGFAVGMREPRRTGGAVQRALRKGQFARIENVASMPGRWPHIAGQSGFTTSVAAPITIQGALWGALVATGRLELLSVSTEEQLTRFADLAGIAMSAAQARSDLRMLAEEQAALSRVAALVVRGAVLDEVFTAVAVEASGLVDRAAAWLVRLELDSSFVLVAATADSNVPLGFRGKPRQGALLSALLETGNTARVENLPGTPWAEADRRMTVGPTVAIPVTVEGRLWGALAVSLWHVPPPDNVEHRLLKFAELAGAAIANAENKANLTASRAHVVATADEARRRLQRDVHDSAQQRLVHTILTLKLAQQSIATGSAPDALVAEALLNAERASSELRDIVRGILPAALTRGGLRLGLESLLSDLLVPVDLDVTAPRCSMEIEQTAYLIVAEALNNVAKHAHADRAAVSVTLDGGALDIEVRDDGIGGADPARGTGLIGLADRVDAIEGALTLTSPPGGGTTLRARLPI